MEAKEYRGLWWLPSNKERKVAGVLAYTPGEEFRLELIGSFNAEYDGTILAPLKAKTMEPVIHGQASDGSNITLFDSTCGVSHKECAEFSTSVYKAKAIVVGTHLNNRDEKRFFKASVRIPELSYWLYPAMVEQIYQDTKNGHGIIVKMRDIEDGERMVGKVNVSKQMSICLCRDASYHSGDLSFNPSFEQFTSLQIETSEDMSLMDYYEAVVRYEQFMSFATFREVGFSELRLFSRDNYYETIGGKHYNKPIIFDIRNRTKPNPKKIAKHEFIFEYNQIKDHYSQAVKRWFSKDMKFHAIRSHFMDSIDYHGPFSYINFLVVIQAIEGYGRRYMTAEIKKFKEGLPKDRKRRPLFEMLSAIFKSYADVNRIDHNVDIDAITQTRNYHSHLFAQRGDKAVDGVELYKLTNELRKLLMCCIMSYMNFSNRDIDRLFNNSDNSLFYKL